LENYELRAEVARLTQELAEARADLETANIIDERRLEPLLCYSCALSILQLERAAHVATKAELAEALDFWAISTDLAAARETIERLEKAGDIIVSEYVAEFGEPPWDKLKQLDGTECAIQAWRALRGAGK